MRLSSSTIYQKNTDNILNGQNKWQKTGLNLGSGKKILAPADDPIGTSKALALKQEQSLHNQFEATRKELEDSLGFQDKVFNSSISILTKVKETLVYAGNELLTDIDRKTLATTLQGLKDQLLTLANSQDTNGRFSFAGPKNDKPPFIIDELGKVSYVGGQSTINVGMAPARDTQIGFNGMQVFMSGTTIKEPDGSISETNVFESFDYAIDALNLNLLEHNEGERELYWELLGKAGRGIDNTFNNIGTISSATGSLLVEFDILSDLAGNLNVDFQTQISNAEDVDYAKAASDYMRQQAGLEAAQKTFMMMEGMSLFKR